MSRTFNRSGVALATAFACLMLMASPASANPTHSATITGGTVNIASPPNSIPLGGGGSAACPPSTVTVAHDEAVSPHTLDISALSTTGEFVLSGNTWVAEINRLSSTPGTHGAGTISNVQVAVSAVIRGPIVAGECLTKNPPVRCTLNTALLAFNGTFDNAGGGNPNEPEVGDVATVSANPVPILTSSPLPCLAPFATYRTGAGTAGVSNLTLLFNS